MRSILENIQSRDFLFGNKLSNYYKKIQLISEESIT